MLTGPTPLTSSEIWNALVQAEKLTKTSKPVHLLLAFRYLHKYDTQIDLGQFFKISSHVTITKHCKNYVGLIASLLITKMLSWEEADEDDMIHFMSVDGTHCPIEEPRPFSTIWSSHKLGGDAGVNYEFGLSISRPKLLWLYGPTQPGALNDLQVAEKALIPAMREFGNGQRRIIGDGIFGAEHVSDVMCTKNIYDPWEIVNFKNRVSARHEVFNKMVKKFNVFKMKFREIWTSIAHTWKQC